MLLGIAGAASAGNQPDSTLNKEVEVIKAYQPSISESFKIGTNPQIRDTVLYTPTFSYSIEPATLPVEKNIQHLPVVKLGNPPREKANTGYVKAGLGYEITPYAEILINTPSSKNTNFGIHLFHYSSFPDVMLNSGIKTGAPFSRNRVNVSMKNTFRKALLDWEIGYDRSGYRYYGFPGTDSLAYRSTEQDTTTLFNKKQAINEAHALFTLSNQHDARNFVYTGSLGYNFLWNATGQTAHHGFFDGNFLLKRDRFDGKLGALAEYFYQDSIINYYTGNANHQFIHVQLSPQVVFEREKWSLEAGFNLGTVIDDDTTALFHISPKIRFTYRPIEGWLNLFAGSDGGFHTRQYAKAVNDNPYLNPSLEMKPGQEIIRVFGGLSGKVSRTISYIFDVDYRIYENQPFYYLSQYVFPDGHIHTDNLFQVQYDSFNQLRFGGKLRYSSQNIRIGLEANYYTYSVTGQSPLTHLPDFDVSLEADFQITSRWSAHIDASVVGERLGELKTWNNTWNPGTGKWDPVLSGTTLQTLETIIDINLGVDYAFSKKLHFFLFADNILNQHFETWHGYNNRGIMIMAGAKYIF